MFGLESGLKVNCRCVQLDFDLTSTEISENDHFWAVNAFSCEFENCIIKAVCHKYRRHH